MPRPDNNLAALIKETTYEVWLSLIITQLTGVNNMDLRTKCRFHSQPEDTV